MAGQPMAALETDWQVAVGKNQRSYDHGSKLSFERANTTFRQVARQ
jgi:hypothetical protein